MPTEHRPPTYSSLAEIGLLAAFLLIWLFIALDSVGVLDNL